VAEEYRRLDHEVRGEFRGEFDVTVRLLPEIQLRRLLAEVGPDLNGLTERVGRGVVTWQASSIRWSKMIGRFATLPMPARMIFPVLAWL